MRFLVFFPFLLLGMKAASHSKQFMEEGTKAALEACNFFEPLALCYKNKDTHETETPQGEQPTTTTSFSQDTHETRTQDETMVINFLEYGKCTEIFFSKLKKDVSTLENPIIKGVAISIMLTQIFPPEEKEAPWTVKDFETFVNKKITNVITDYRCVFIKSPPPPMDLESLPTLPLKKRQR